MLIVYIPGVWDLLHVGHVRVLQNAKALGDRLVVGVPADNVVLEDKGLPPIIPLQDRIEMLNALKCVDIVVAYYRLEFLTHLRLIDPDILAVGETWGSDQRHNDAMDWASRNDRRVVRLPYYVGESTSLIKQRVNNVSTSR